MSHNFFLQIIKNKRLFCRVPGDSSSVEFVQICRRSWSTDVDAPITRLCGIWQMTPRLDTLYVFLFRVHHERSWFWSRCLPRSDMSSESIYRRIEKRDQVQTIDFNDVNIRVRVNDVRVLEILTSRHRLRNYVPQHMMDIILQSTLTVTRSLSPNSARRISNVANCLDDAVIF